MIYYSCFNFWCRRRLLMLFSSIFSFNILFKSFTDIGEYKSTEIFLQTLRYISQYYNVHLSNKPLRVTTPSVSGSTIAIHCDAWKSIPPPFPSVTQAAQYIPMVTLTLTLGMVTSLHFS